jgi:hypothetical protein
MIRFQIVAGIALATLLPLQATAGAPAAAAESEAEAKPEEESDADAGSGEVSAGASLSTSADGADSAAWTDADLELQKREDTPWIKRWAPEARLMGEVGLYGGLILPSSSHELFGADPALGADQGWKAYSAVGGDIGLRAGFYPMRFLGVEAEGGVWPLGVDGGQSALGWTVRAHVVGQVGLWSVTPFVLLGGGGIGVSSARESVGSDIDPAMHFGGGLKFFLSRWVALRLDGRGIVSYSQGLGCNVVTGDISGCLDRSQFSSIHGEILLGLSATLGRERRRATTEPAPEPEPAPVEEPSDRDGDGILDGADECPDEPGVEEYNGCPIPDTDGDGILDPDDECPEEPGVEEYKGCPIPDTDGDGFKDPDDPCVEEDRERVRGRRRLPG